MDWATQGKDAAKTYGEGFKVCNQILCLLKLSLCALWLSPVDVCREGLTQHPSN